MRVQLSKFIYLAFCGVFFISCKKQERHYTFSETNTDLLFYNLGDTIKLRKDSSLYQFIVTQREITPTHGVSGEIITFTYTYDYAKLTLNSDSIRWKLYTSSDPNDRFLSLEQTNNDSTKTFRQFNHPKKIDSTIAINSITYDSLRCGLIKYSKYSPYSTSIYFNKDDGIISFCDTLYNSDSTIASISKYELIK